MDKLVPGGVYRHYKGDYYLVLFEVSLNTSFVENEDVWLYVGANVVGLYASKRVPSSLEVRSLFVARAHADMAPIANNPIDAAVYVPLYTDKPGRRISVRPVKDFFEEVPVKCPRCGDGVGYPCGECCNGAVAVERFTYVGTEIPR